MDYNERSLRTEIVGLEEALWQMNLQHHHMETEIGPFPERPGEPDCSYYLRTGHCRYGMNCRYNHPPNRKQTAAIARSNGEFPERIGQPECQYYLKTGTCKFGATCKFHHPRDKAGTVGRVALNALGYPLRPNEKECAYYLRTGQCKFGNTCKFHHPEPLGTLIPVHGSSLFTPVHPPTASGPQPYSGLATWPIPRTSFIQSPRWQGPSSYTPMILPQGIISVSGWNTYPPQGQLGSISSQDGQQQAIAAGPMYGPSHQMDAMVSGIQGTFSPFPPGSPGLTPLTLQLPASATQREAMFPERPGQPECQFYMKTGDCKYGMSCRFHHPKDRIIPTPTCALNHLGLPIRPDMPACNFFARYGVCKYGSTCKFDHSVGHLSYNQSISSPADISVGHHQIVPLPPLHTSASFSSYSAMESAGEMHTEHSSSDTQQLPSVVKSLGVNT